jgi:hypothetical protein
MRKLYWTASLIAVSVGCTTSDRDASENVGEASAAVTSGSTYTFKLPLMVGDTGNCMDVTAASTSTGAKIEEYNCNGTGAQSFTVNQIKTSGGTGCGYYTIKNTHSGLCLDVAGGIPLARGDLIDQWTCKSWSGSSCPTKTDGIANQAWAFQSSNGYQKIVSLYSDATYPSYCLDVTGGDTHTANGTPIELWNCSGGNNQTWNPSVTTSGSAGACNYAAWSSATGYGAGAIVEYTQNGNYHYYKASASNTSVDPSCVSYQHGSAGPCGWYAYSDCCNPCNTTPPPAGSSASCAGRTWDPYTCGPGGSNDGSGNGNSNGIAGVVSSSQYGSMYPNHIAFYSYAGLTSVSSAYAAFANSSDSTIRKREAAAFLANMDLESGGLTCIDEIDETGNYCDTSRSYGCPAQIVKGTRSCPGQTVYPTSGNPPSAYYGRGPLQMSWNFNYYLAGQSFGTDLLTYPGNVSFESPKSVSNESESSSISWKTAVWYWMTQPGPGGLGGNCHDAMMQSGGSGGFGETIKHINGAVECPSLGGSNTASRDSRINKYKAFCDMLGVSYGNNLSC